MIVDVFIIRKDMNKFLLIDPETGNWDWTKNLEEATIYQTQEKAEEVKLQRNLGDTAWVYQIPYSIVNPPQRKKKSLKIKSKRKICKCK
jgi:hypothetical protein